MRKIVKVGTKVKVKSGLESLRDTNGRIDGLYCDTSMYQYEGQEFEVTQSWISRETQKNLFTLSGSDTWNWNLSMIEEVSEENMRDLDRVCHDCDRELEEGEELIYLENYDRYVCQDCLDNNYSQCDDCYDYIDNDDLHSVEGGNRYVCDSCFDSYYECYDCGEYHYNEDMYYDEDEDRYYCSDCWDSHTRNRIYSYHSFNDWHFYKASGEENPPYYLGFELEVENPNNDDSMGGYLLDHNLPIIRMHDGSLNYGGFENISHPLSYKYIMEHKEDFKNLLDTFIENGYKSHETDTCGLHFHVSRPYQEELNKFNTWNMTDEEKEQYKEVQGKQDLVIERILLLMETYKEPLIAFSRRKPSQLQHWAQFLSDRVNKDSGEIKSLYYIKKHKDTSSRYQALNLTNRNTIEFRIFRGTLKYETFMATIELVNNIVEQCSDLSKPITEINWNTITQGEFVRAYCEEKGIESDKLIVDNSEEEIAREQIIKEGLLVAYKKLIRVYNKELQRLSQDFNIKSNNALSTIHTKINKALREMGNLRTMLSYLDNVVQTSNSEYATIEDLQFRVKSFLTSYDLDFVDWSIEEYKDIKDTLMELL